MCMKGPSMILLKLIFFSFFHVTFFSPTYQITYSVVVHSPGPPLHPLQRPHPLHPCRNLPDLALNL